MSDSVAIVSGGLDSTTLVYDMLAKGFTPHLVSFNYGQRHSKELTFAGITARSLKLQHDIVDLTGLTHLISNSALTSSGIETMGSAFKDDGGVYVKSLSEPIEVPEGHYAEDTMKATVVPNRNMIMLSIAAGIAVNNKYQTVGIGVHAGDHFVYPDCRPAFIYAASDAITIGNQGFAEFSNRSTHAAIHAPFLYASKADIAYRALELGVPLHLTWSCYKGGENHCGKCGTCVERLEAIDQAQNAYYDNLGERVRDETVYDDTEFWKTTTSRA